MRCARAEVARPDARGEPVLGAVRALDDFLLVAPGLDGDDRAEDLLACGRRCPSGSSIIAGVEVVAVGERALARDRRRRRCTGALGAGRLDVAVHALAVRRETSGPTCVAGRARRRSAPARAPRRTARGTRRAPPRAGQPRGGEADLAVLEAMPMIASAPRLEVGVRADHEGALAAELEQRRREVPRSPRGSAVPSGAARERDLGDAGVATSAAPASGPSP